MVPNRFRACFSFKFFCSGRMAKRGADIQLTDRNWNEEDEPEEAGHFKQAGNEEISKRVIKKARRRVQGSDSPSAFKGFQGFGSLVPTCSSTPLPTATKLTSVTGFGNLSSLPEKTVTNEEETGEAFASETQYMKQLKSLNLGVCEWIKKHITQDPYVDLSPVFKDYEKHLANIEKKFTFKGKSVDTNLGTTLSSAVVPTELPASTGLVGLSKPTGSLVTSTSNTNGETHYNLGENSVSKTSEAAETSGDTAKTDSQVRSSPEEDAFYSIRCKLFFKRAGCWSELGVGMLSLKNTDKKTQVLVRNDTALGKILLNIFINDASPISRSGKNNVLLMSIPNPPVFLKDGDGDNSKPVSYLIRVKTSENADELCKQMESCKKSA